MKKPFKLRKKDINNLLVTLALLIVSLLFIIPVFYCIFTSVKTSQEIMQDVTFFPHRLTWENYEYVFARVAKYLKFYWNTIVVTVSTVLITVVMSSLQDLLLPDFPSKAAIPCWRPFCLC